MGEKPNKQLTVNDRAYLFFELYTELIEVRVKLNSIVNKLIADQYDIGCECLIILDTALNNIEQRF